MEPKNRFLVCIWLPALFLSACDFSPKPEPVPPEPPPEKAYHAEILWEREINTISSAVSPLIEGQYCYYPARENYPGGGQNIVKISMEENGRVEWESRGIGYSSTEKPQKIGPHIYLPDQSGLIYVYNDSDGKLAATVMLGNDETEAKNNNMEFSPVAVSGPYLFWGREDGLMRFNSEQIDFSAPPGEIQSIIPELIWSNSSQPQIYTNLIPENGILYFITGSYRGKNARVLAALNAETGDVIWEREVSHIDNLEWFSYFLNELVFNGDKLIVVGETFSSYDKSTGVPTLENISMGYETNRYWRDRITLYNNRLFYLDNWDLVSVNADTGEFMGVDASFRAESGVQFSYEIAIYKDA